MIHPGAEHNGSEQDSFDPLFNWIQGERRAPVSGQYLDWIDPMTDEVGGQIPESDFMDVVAAVHAANQVSAEWARVDWEKRAFLLESWAGLVERDADQLAKVAASETGQVFEATKTFDVLRAAEVLRLHAQILREPHPGNRNRLPGGLSGLLTGWSEPIFQLARRLAPAIGGGGPAIVKPSSLVSRSTLRFVELSKEAGIPSGVINVVCGSGVNAGEALIAHPAIGSIAFVGSFEVGGRVRKLAAEHGKRLHMGLGGRNAVAIYGDIELATEIPKIARVLFDFHHETAWRGSRVFIQEANYKPILEALAAEVSSWTLGSPLDSATQLGPIPGRRLRDRYKSAVHQSVVEKGKSLVADLRAPERGLFAVPFASVDLTLCSTLQQEEVPGPFVSLSSFKYLHDVVKHANNSPLGQVAYVFGADREKIMKTGMKIEAGRVFINSGPVRELDVEASALKASGQGGDGPRALLDFFSRSTYIYQS